MRIRLQGPSHASSLLAELNRCRQSRRYCDVFLQVGNRTFPAHRAVLACAGTYFRNLFTRTPAVPSTAAFSLEFISPANFEKVLTFVYTGEILTDLIDVGVLYELAERLGVGELVRACHATFPDLQASVSANCKTSSPAHLQEPVVAAAGPATVATSVTSVSASSACSSAASCSSLSSSAAPTPAAAGTLTLDLKAEDIQSHIGYGQMTADHHLTGGHTLLPSGHSGDGSGSGILPLGLHLKTEQGLEEEEEEEEEEDGSRSGREVFDSRDPAASDSCSFPDSSAQLGANACPSMASTGEAAGNLQGKQAEAGAANASGDSGLMFGEADTEEVLRENGAMEEHWRQLAGDIIELSDDENFMEDGEEEEDEDDLVCLENGEGGNSSQVPASLLSCKACGTSLPLDPAAIRRHAETHLTELGQCRLCGLSFPDHAAAAAHTLTHVGLQLLTCDMCHLQFCSRNKLLRHHRQAASGYTLPQRALTCGGLGPTAELQCVICSKTLGRNLQAVRDHLLVHVCPQSLSCSVCRLPQPSLCALLWHALDHLGLPVFSCPHCAHCFVERHLLDRHMALHAEEAATRERERSALRGLGLLGDAVGGRAEELQCFLCPQTFRSSSAFQYHLSLHSGEPPGATWSGKRKADQSLEGPPTSCPSSFPRDGGGLVKVGGLGVGYSLPEKFFQGPSLLAATPSNGSSAQDGGAGAAGVRGKWYRCRYCGKRFAHSGEFTYHLRIHTGEKPYQCKVCLRFFRGRSTMICHLKTHAGALMYRCTVCGLYFSTLKLVSSHMELHKDHLPPDFNIEQTFMYNDHSKEPLPAADS